MSRGRAEWSSASVARAGESVSGDRCTVCEHDEASLFAVVDGVGHGPAAARAATIATDLIESHAGLAPEELMQRCHRALAGSRGAVLLLVSFDADGPGLEWTGVGDVLGVLVRADASARPRRIVLMPREGIAGVSLPRSPRSLVSVLDGDQLVIATDGVRSDFVDSVLPGEEPRLAAARILARHYKGNDDGLVLAVRFRIPPT